MSLWFHSTILATSLAATVAVGLASAAIYEPPVAVAQKTDRLVVSTAGDSYLTFETRKEDGVSVLNRVQVDALD